MLTLLMTGFAGFVVWALWAYIVRPALEDFGVLAPPPHILSSSPQFSASAELPSPPQSDAVDRPATDDAGTGSDWLDDDTMLHITKRELVHLMARIVLTDDDDRLLSQDIISRAAGIGKERAAEMIRAARGEPDPPLVNPLRVRDERGERLIPR